MSDFIHNLARSRMATACSTQCRPQWQRKIAEKKGKAQFKMFIFLCTELNACLGRPKWFEVDSGVELKV